MKKSALSALALCVLTSSGCASTAEGGQTKAVPTPVQVTGQRFEHTPDLMGLIKRFLSPEGFMDPAFPATVAKPSPYLSDFYGVQAITDVSRSQILSDFVPRLAEKVTEDANSVTLRFPKGYTAKFYPISTLSAAGQKLPVSHVEISGDTWQALGANLEDFRTGLEKAKLAKRYLIPNKHFGDEKITYQLMTTGKPTPVQIDPDRKAFLSSKSGVLLLPEGVHGRPEDVDVAIDVLQKGQVDWIGLEMVSLEFQPILDAFNVAKKGTPEYTSARAAVVDYFAKNWNGRDGKKTSGEENHYFRLAEAAHDSGTKLIAIEASSIEYIIFRYGETQFGAAVRNLWWVKALPRSGRGIVFGGSAHFNLAQPVNVQDFIANQTPGRPVFSLKVIDKKPKS